MTPPLTRDPQHAQIPTSQRLVFMGGLVLAYSTLEMVVGFGELSPCLYAVVLSLHVVLCTSCLYSILCVGRSWTCIPGHWIVCLNVDIRHELGDAYV
jgi:hypothetical protein